MGPDRRSTAVEPVAVIFVIAIIIVAAIAIREFGIKRER